MERSSPQAKLEIELPESDWHNYGSETLWATHIEGVIYRIDNVPLFAYGIAYGDKVRVVFEDGRAFPIIEEVVTGGGHSTYRLLMPSKRGAENNPEFEMFWVPLEKLGCSFEGYDATLIAVDVPPESDIFQVYKLLEAGEEKGVWSFEEGHCGHELKD